LKNLVSRQPPDRIGIKDRVDDITALALQRTS
jgi:hypothetical protein